MTRRSAGKPSRIPPEVTDVMIDFLHDDRNALASCSLACRAFYPVAHYHLSRSLNFPTPKAAFAFWQILRMRPAFGHHARSASFAKVCDSGLSTFSVNASGSTALAPSSASRSLVPTDHSPAEIWAHIFHALPNVRRLEFLFLDALDAPLRLTLASAFGGALEELTLQYCRFKRFGDFVTLFWSFPRLKRLTARGVSWEEVETTVPPRPGAGISADAKVAGEGPTDSELGDNGAGGLVSLHLGRDLDLPTLVDWLIAERLCTGLRSLSLCSASQRDAVVLGDIVRAAGPSLQELALDWFALSYNDIPLPHEFTLASCTALRTLQLCCPIRLNGTLSWVPTAISQLSTTALTDLMFEIRLLGDLDAIDWAHIDHVLAEERFAALNSVQFRIKTWHTALVRGSEACSSLVQRLPGLSNKGLIQFTKQ